MAIKWTEEQYRAISAPKSNLLVAAAAGSGKTQVLTGRILKRIIDDNLDINRILIVTFTNAAASEMRERIMKNISEALRESPQNKHLKKQLSLISGASITTVHSFCNEIIKNNYLAAGLDGGYRIADGAESALIREEAAENAVERLYGEGDEDFLRLADCYSGPRSDSNLYQLAINTYGFFESMTDPEKWLRDMTSVYQIGSAEELKDCAFAKFILNLGKSQCGRILSVIREGLQSCPAYENVFLSDLETFENIAAAFDDWDKAYYLLSKHAWMRMPSSRNIDPAEVELAKSYRDDIKAIGTDILKLVTCNTEETLSILKKSYPHIKSLCRLVTVFKEEYQNLKTENKLLDYSDLEHIAISLLSDNGRPSEIACNLRDKFDEIYVDEYQDSNEVQETIFNLISREHTGEPNIFMVGDVKQSIYAFRNTTPRLFMDKKDTYLDSGKNVKCLLSKNFRSRREIIDYVNSVFERIFSRQASGIEYNHEEWLFAGAEYPESDENRIEINILDKEEPGINKESEAAFIAEKIREVVETKRVYDKDTKSLRPVRYSDIVILLRSLKGNTQIIEEALSAAGIPVYTEKGTGFYESPEITAILSLLTIIDNPVNDIQLLSVMRSHIFGFTENELAQIRLCRKKCDYYYAAVKAAGMDNPLGLKVRNMLNQIKRWRRLSEYLQVDELLWALYTETDYLNFASSMEDGEQKRANLVLLFEKARQFEETSFSGLFNFLNYISKARAKEETGGAKLVSENHNVVRIMSIHKSKGLEFPIVFLSNCGKKFNLRDTSGNFLLDKDLGLGLKYVDPDLRICYDTPAKTAVSEKMRADFVAEELRVLYVALTRAKEYLFITGAVDSVQKSLIKWNRFNFSPAEVLHSGNFINLLVPCAVDSGCALTSESNASPDNLIHIEFIKEVKAFSSEKSYGSALPEPSRADDEVAKILEYVYPHYSLSELPSKITVTELKRLVAQEDSDSVIFYKSDNLKTPEFQGGGTGVSPAERGSLMHFVMQNIDYKTVNSTEQVKEYIRGLLSDKIISEGQAKAIDPEKIALFFNSPLGQRMKNADRVFREVPFSTIVPASVFTGNEKYFSEKIILQGIIDCYFFEGDKITLLDYKNDKVTDRDKILEKYKFQLDTYALALEKKYFSKIFQKVIYLFENNDIIECN